MKSFTFATAALFLVLGLVAVFEEHSSGSGIMVQAGIPRPMYHRYLGETDEDEDMDEEFEVAIEEPMPSVDEDDPEEVFATQEDTGEVSEEQELEDAAIEELVEEADEGDLAETDEGFQR